MLLVSQYPLLEQQWIQNGYVLILFCPWFIFSFLLFLDMMVYDNDPKEHENFGEFIYKTEETMCTYSANSGDFTKQRSLP